MNRKTVLLVLACLVAGSGLSSARDYSITSDVGFASEYVFRGLKLAGPSIRPSLELGSRGLPAGDFYTGAWANTPVRGDEVGLNEVNLYGGFDFELQHNVFLDLGAMFYHYPRPQGGDEDFRVLDRKESLEPYLGVRFEEIADTGLNAGVYLFYDIEESFTLEGNIEHRASFGAGVPATLDIGGIFGYVDEHDYAYYGAYAVVPYHLNDVTTVKLGGHYEGRNSLDHDPLERSRDFLYWTASVRLSY